MDEQVKPKLTMKVLDGRLKAVEAAIDTAGEPTEVDEGVIEAIVDARIAAALDGLKAEMDNLRRFAGEMAGLDKGEPVEGEVLEVQERKLTAADLAPEFLAEIVKQLGSMLRARA